MTDVNINEVADTLMGDCLTTSINCRAKVKAALMNDYEVAEDKADELAGAAFDKWVDIYTG